MIRADKAISDITGLSRTDVKKQIRLGAFRVSDMPVGSPSQQLPDDFLLSYNGREYKYTSYVYIMLNKPRGIVSASRDPKAPTVISILPPDFSRRGLFPAGRLDADSQGFVLITNDGIFAHDMLSPAHHVEKTYRVTLEHELQDDEKEHITGGIVLRSGETFAPCTIIFPDVSDRASLEITLTEGKYHEIKRMFAACGNNVTSLFRVSIGGLQLDPALAPGECRYITERELKTIVNITK